MGSRRRSSMGMGGNPPGTGLAIASIVLGIGAILLIWLKFIVFFLAIFFILVSIAGILMAIKAGKMNEEARTNSALPAVGIAANVLSLLIYSVALITCTVCTTTVCTIISSAM